MYQVLLLRMTPLQTACITRLPVWNYAPTHAQIPTSAFQREQFPKHHYCTAFWPLLTLWVTMALRCIFCIKPMEKNKACITLPGGLSSYYTLYSQYCTTQSSYYLALRTNYLFVFNSTFFIFSARLYCMQQVITTDLILSQQIKTVPVGFDFLATSLSWKRKQTFTKAAFALLDQHHRGNSRSVALLVVKAPGREPVALCPGFAFTQRP